ncbi:uncharacterized protein LOC117650504 [Thrips palmi]|uniref:Uncharacterized protein LOC117650504 n=1 Tax=Thrips palmi TaxID=161013 RepID=A0A6P8ZWU8_THRPL|nr:uncharacterized protein LOC117650504 [Thrips palmi]XP_034249869.1 uncharacterized protein LOC117650504 [Thrips palmi]
MLARHRAVSLRPFQGQGCGAAARSTLFLLLVRVALLAGRAAAALSSLEHMNANPGDMIWCRMGPVAHWLLASDTPGFFINVQPGSPSYVVKEVHFSEGGGKSSVKKCANRGPGLFGSRAVARAREHLGRPVYYHLLRCNCEHYVKAWAGKPLCANQAMCPNKKCRPHLPAYTFDSLSDRRIFDVISASAHGFGDAM